MSCTRNLGMLQPEASAYFPDTAGLLAPSADGRLFPLFEWWGARRYRRHPQRAALAQQQSLRT